MICAIAEFLDRRELDVGHERRLHVFVVARKVLAGGGREGAVGAEARVGAGA